MPDPRLWLSLILIMVLALAGLRSPLSAQEDDVAEAMEAINAQIQANPRNAQSYLQRSDDFIRFCCHLHIHEMLSARGGADETRVRWEWSDCR